MGTLRLSAESDYCLFGYSTSTEGQFDARFHIFGTNLILSVIADRLQNRYAILINDPDCYFSNTIFAGNNLGNIASCTSEQAYGLQISIDDKFLIIQRSCYEYSVGIYDIIFSEVKGCLNLLGYINCPQLSM